MDVAQAICVSTNANHVFLFFFFFNITAHELNDATVYKKHEHKYQISLFPPFPSPLSLPPRPTISSFTQEEN